MWQLQRVQIKGKITQHSFCIMRQNRHYLNFQSLQKSQQLITCFMNIDTYFNHELRQNSELWLCSHHTKTFNKMNIAHNLLSHAIEWMQYTLSYKTIRLYLCCSHQGKLPTLCRIAPNWEQRLAYALYKWWLNYISAHRQWMQIQ